MSETTNANSLLAPPRFIDNPDDCYFYHTMDLPGLGVTHGDWDLRGRFVDYIGGVEVAGKSVLDVGAATGYLSFEAEQRGARVLSVDMGDPRHQAFLPFKDKLYYCDYESFISYHTHTVERWKNAYWLCHRLLGSKAEVYYGNIYDLPRELGTFDVAIVGAVLEHLSDPITALASISRLTKETMVLVTPLLQTDEQLARFEGSAANPDQDYTWWTYSVGLYREVLAMLGFRIASITYSTYYRDCAGRYEERPTLVAVRT
jgi:SAM-dependent methyltransferase